MTAAIVPVAELSPHLPARGALIGLDLGTKTIGVAASDPDRRVAAGVETVARTRFPADAGRLLALAAERKAAGFVLGLPINMDGSEGPRAQSTRAFARNMARLTELPIALWDERLSTAAVERELIAADASRAGRKAVIDQHAAIYILQGALDRLRRDQLPLATSGGLGRQSTDRPLGTRLPPAIPSPTPRPLQPVSRGGRTPEDSKPALAGAAESAY
jgi:putative Holliday junction resolvase